MDTIDNIQTHLPGMRQIM